MTVPVAAIVAASEAMRHHNGPRVGDCCLRAALEAAVPAIREALAQELRAYDDAGCVEWAALAADFIVRGGKP